MSSSYHSDMPLPPLVETDDPDALADALATTGVCLISGMVPPRTLDALRGDLARLRLADALQPAAVGRAQSRSQRTDIRGDSTLWLDDPRCNAVAGDYLAALDALRLQLNQRLFLGLAEVEAHYAAYPAGSGYVRHRDRFRDSDARVLSLVSYLNRAWEAAHGGALRLHLEQGAIDIQPQAGVCVCFLSELEHEVLPATRERLSIAAWMRRAP